MIRPLGEKHNVAMCRLRRGVSDLLQRRGPVLAHAAGLARPPKVTVAARTVDLVRDLELALDGPADLVTTSALLDLVSQDWLDRPSTD